MSPHLTPAPPPLSPPVVSLSFTWCHDSHLWPCWCTKPILWLWVWTLFLFKHFTFVKCITHIYSLENHNSPPSGLITCFITFKCARARCKTFPFIRNVEKIWGPKRSMKITDHFTCTSATVIYMYCITCTLCKKCYIGKTGRRLGGRFREHLTLKDYNENNK